MPEDFTPQSPSLNPAAVVFPQFTAPDDSPGTRKRKRSRKRGSGSESSGESREREADLYHRLHKVVKMLQYSTDEDEDEDEADRRRRINKNRDRAIRMLASLAAGADKESQKQLFFGAIRILSYGMNLPQKKIINLVFEAIHVLTSPGSPLRQSPAPPQSPPREGGETSTENEAEVRDGATGMMLQRRKHPKMLYLQRGLAQLCLARLTMKRLRSAHLYCVARLIMKRRRRQSAPNVAKVVADTRKRKRNERSGKRIRKEVRAAKNKCEIERIIRALEKRDRRRYKMKAGKIIYPGRCIPPKNFTMSEFTLCREYMNWRYFESSFPIPRKYRTLKLHYNQIRKTRGYGVTVINPLPPRATGSMHFYPIPEAEVKKDPILANQMSEMEKDLVREMQQKPEGMQLTNVVEVRGGLPYVVYLISHSFEQQAVIPTSPGDGDVEVVADRVEAMYKLRHGPGRRIYLTEWKLKNGSKIVYCSSSTKAALEDFNEWFYTYVARSK